MLVVDVVEESLLRQANELHPVCPGTEEAFENLQILHGGARNAYYIVHIFYIVLMESILSDNMLHDVREFFEAFVSFFSPRANIAIEKFVGMDFPPGLLS